jgi:AcrR family transcriptional regulator
MAIADEEKHGRDEHAPGEAAGGRAAPKGGREAVVARVLDAAEELFARRPYGAVSVREIADAAGVSHALVHRYVGPKAEILTAVLSRHEGMFADAAGDAATVRDATRIMLGGDAQLSQRYFRLVLRVSLDSVLRELTDVDFPASRLLARLAVAQTASAAVEPPFDPRLVVAAGVSLVVGFAGLRDTVLEAVGAEDMDPADIDEQIAGMVDALLAATVPEPHRTG